MRRRLEMEVMRESPTMQQASLFSQPAFDEMFVPEGQVRPRYVKLGHGRDYTDIVPVKGVYRGSARQQLDVTVTVSVIDE